jgi:LmbE family N-acetylglucosaminyl deacetylase
MQPTHHHPRLPTADVSHLGTILQIWAHPDDESYLAGGLSLRAAVNRQRVVCVTATHGEAGGDPALAPEVVAAQRDRELAAALDVLGIDEHVQLDYADGGCAAADPREATRRLADIIEYVQPDTIVTFGPDGVTGHADHRAVSRWATSAWIASGCRGQLLYASTLHTFASRFRELHAQLNAFEPGFPVSTPRHDLSVLLSLDEPTLLRKRAALRAHHSQTAGVEAIMGEATYLSWWQDECFRRAGFVGSRLRSIERPRRVATAA